MGAISWHPGPRHLMNRRWFVALKHWFVKLFSCSPSSMLPASRGWETKCWVDVVGRPWWGSSLLLILSKANVMHSEDAITEFVLLRLKVWLNCFESTVHTIGMSYMTMCHPCCPTMAVWFQAAGPNECCCLHGSVGASRNWNHCVSSCNSTWEVWILVSSTMVPQLMIPNQERAQRAQVHLFFAGPAWCSAVEQLFKMLWHNSFFHKAPSKTMPWFWNIWAIANSMVRCRLSNPRWQKSCSRSGSRPNLDLNAYC